MFTCLVKFKPLICCSTLLIVVLGFICITTTHITHIYTVYLCYIKHDCNEDPYYTSIIRSEQNDTTNPYDYLDALWLLVISTSNYCGIRLDKEKTTEKQYIFKLNIQHDQNDRICIISCGKRKNETLFSFIFSNKYQPAIHMTTK